MTPSRPLAVIGAAATLIAGTAMGAAAITGGQRDGDQHPNVALITFYAGGRLSMCTATLVSPTVLLTAGHCTAGVSGRVGATFESVIAEQPAPDGSPRCRSHPGRPGTPTRSSPRPATSPAPPTPTRATRPSPIPATGTTSASSSSTSRSTTSPPRSLAAGGYLDQFPPNILNETVFTAVGYGTEVRAAESGPQNPTPQPYPLVRRLADAPGQKLTDQILQVNSNEKDPRGTGGTCFGDSGGPAFHAGYRHGHELQQHPELPLHRRFPARGHPGRAGLARRGVRRHASRLTDSGVLTAALLTHTSTPV